MIKMRAEEHNNKKEWRTRGLSVNNDRAMREREREGEGEGERERERL